jgi:hypothetical protein
MCVNDVYSLMHIILMFFTWSGNHKFYIQFLRLLGLQSFVIFVEKAETGQFLFLIRLILNRFTCSRRHPFLSYGVMTNFLNDNPHFFLPLHIKKHQNNVNSEYTAFTHGSQIGCKITQHIWIQSLI